MALAHQICSITNPFCEGSKGTKYPDASTAYTLAYPIRYRIPVTTNAAGTAFIIATAALYVNDVPTPPTLQYLLTGGTVDSAGVILTMGSMTQQPFGELFANNSARIVSAGLKFTPSQNLMTAQGLANIIELPSTDDLDVEYLGLNLGSQSFPTYITMPLRSTDSLYGVLRPSGPKSREFNPYEPWSTTKKTTNDWSSICLFVQGGAASSTVGFVDVFYNFEIQLDSVAARVYRPLLSASAGNNQFLITKSTEILRHTPVLRGDDAAIDKTFLSSAYDTLKSIGSAAWEHRADIRDLALTGAAIYTGNYPAAGATMTHAMIRNVD
jgi:hypothetical protein